MSLADWRTCQQATCIAGCWKVCVVSSGDPAIVELKNCVLFFSIACLPRRALSLLPNASHIELLYLALLNLSLSTDGADISAYGAAEEHEAILCS